MSKYVGCCENFPIISYARSMKMINNTRSEAFLRKKLSISINLIIFVGFVDGLFYVEFET